MVMEKRPNFLNQIVERPFPDKLIPTPTMFLKKWRIVKTFRNHGESTIEDGVMLIVLKGLVDNLPDFIGPAKSQESSLLFRDYGRMPH